MNLKKRRSLGKDQFVEILLDGVMDGSLTPLLQSAKIGIKKDMSLEFQRVFSIFNYPQLLHMLHSIWEGNYPEMEMC